MLPSIWYETWLDSAGERGLRPTRPAPVAELPGNGIRRRIGHALMSAGEFLAAEHRTTSHGTATRLPR